MYRSEAGVETFAPGRHQSTSSTMTVVQFSISSPGPETGGVWNSGTGAAHPQRGIWERNQALVQHGTKGHLELGYVIRP